MPPFSLARRLCQRNLVKVANMTASQAPFARRRRRMASASDPQNLHDPTDEPVVRSTGVDLSGDATRHLEDGLALCLSGGGYRAALYHVGALWRLNELGLLPKLQRISSVSGGSITAGTLGRNWGRLKFVAGVATAESFQKSLVQPIRGLTEVTIDVPAVGWGIFTPFKSIGDEIAGYYDRYLFDGATLQNLPADWGSADARAIQGPRFVINATNVMTGSLWRFARPYMADYRVGLVRNPTLRLAVAVAASSAFPPFLSPTKLSLAGLTFEPDAELARDPLFNRNLRSQAVLTDGGVYDNLGLETVWKRYANVLVSDAGRRMRDDLDPATDWGMHSRRLIDLLQVQTSNLRRRQLIGALAADDNPHQGAYWGIEADLDKYRAADKVDFPLERSKPAAQVDTRLAALEKGVQDELINWGYANCDASIRSYFLLAGKRWFDANGPLPLPRAKLPY